MARLDNQCIPQDARRLNQLWQIRAGHIPIMVDQKIDYAIFASPAVVTTHSVIISSTYLMVGLANAEEESHSFRN